jgi:hypothetical protein
MVSPVKTVLLKPFDGERDEPPLLKFRLTYYGELKATQRDPDPNQSTPDRLAAHKQGIRRKFHGQLKQLWETNRFLRDHRIHPQYNPWGQGISAGTAVWGADHSQTAIAHNYEINGFRYVPLVREVISLLCSLDIIFLRRDPPGSIISCGDIDNRIKTLIDCLKIPKERNEMPAGDVPKDGEDPFFVLLENDNQVTGLTVETDRLLDPMTNDESDQRMVKLIISVEIRPYDVTIFNLPFA